MFEGLRRSELDGEIDVEGKPLLSRRAFLEIAATLGSLTFLGSACNGRVNAYADEAGDVYFVVTIVDPDQVSIMCVDVSQDPMKPIQGANVTLNSLSKGNQLTGQTDADGVLVLNARELCVQADEEDPVEYSFWANASVEVDGYRSYEAERFPLWCGPTSDGAPNILLTTQPFDASSGDVCLRMASFNGIDVQYRDDTIMKFPSNDAVQSFTFKAQTKEGSSVEFALFANGQQLGESQTATADGNGFAQVSFTGAWVKDLPSKTSFSVSFATGSFSHTADLGLTIEDPEYPDMEPFITDKANFSASRTVVSGNSANATLGNELSMDKSVVNFKIGPVDINMMCDLPWVPISLYRDDRGNEGIQIAFPSINPLKDFASMTHSNGQDGWKLATTSCLELLNGSYEKRLDEYIAGDQARPNSLARAPRLGGYLDHAHANSGFFMGGDISVTFGILILMRRSDTYPKDQQPALAGNLGFEFDGIVTGCFGFAFIAPVLPLPMFIKADFFAESIIRVILGIEVIRRDKDDQKTRLSGNSGVAGIIDITGGLYIGAGIDGLASVSVGGLIDVLMNIEYAKDAVREDKPAPHFTADVTASCVVKLQILGFTTKISVIDPIELAAYDNWNNSLEAPNLADIPMQAEPLKVTPESALGETAKVTALLNAQGVVHGYDLQRVREGLEAMGLAHKEAGIADPFASQSDGPLVVEDAGIDDMLAYDIRAGIRPTLKASAESGVYSDARMKVVTVGSTAYYLRLTTVAINTAGSGMKVCTADDNGMHYVVPSHSSSTSAIPEYVFDPGKTKLVAPDGYGQVGHLSGSDAKDVVIARIPVLHSNEADEASMTAEQLHVKLAVNGKAAAATSFAEVGTEVVYRTRLTVSSFDVDSRTWGFDDVIDFTIASSEEKAMRVNQNDVDFEVTVDGNDLLIGLVSCSRPMKKSYKLEDQLEFVFTSALRYSPGEEAGQRVSQVNTNLSEYLTADTYEWKAIPLALSKKDAGKDARQAIGLATFGKRGLNHALAAHYYPVDGGDDFACNVHITRTDRGGVQLNDYGRFMAYASADVKDSGGSDTVVFGWQLMDKDTTMDTQQARIWMQGASDDGSADSQKATWGLDDAQNIICLGSQKGFIYATTVKDPVDDPKLAGDACHLQLTQMVPQGFQQPDPVKLGVVDTPKFFASQGGDKLYTMRVMEGDVPAPAKSIQQGIRDGAPAYPNMTGRGAQAANPKRYRKGGADVIGEETISVKEYQAIACNWDPRYNRFREFYPLAQLDQSPDQSTAFDTANGVAFMCGTIDDLASQKGDINYIEVPDSVVAMVDSAICLDSFVSQGAHKVHPVVTVNNMGTLPVAQLTFGFSETPGGDPFDTFTMEHLEDYVFEATDQYNHMKLAWRGKQGAPEWGPDDEALLWPGNKRSYRIEMTTLEKWQFGKNNVYVSVIDAVAADFSSQSRSSGSARGFALRAPENEPLTVLDKRFHLLKMGSEDTTLVATGARPNNYKSSDPVPAANTGDPLNPLAIAGVAAAAAAVAAKAAYEGGNDSCEEK